MCDSNFTLKYFNVGLFYHLRMKIVLPLILCFCCKSAVILQVLPAAKLQQQPLLEYDSQSDDDEYYSDPNPKPKDLRLETNHGISFIQNDQQPAVKLEVDAVYSSHYDSHEDDPNYSDPQKDENRCEENFENDPVQRYKRQINPGIKAQYYFDGSYRYEDYKYDKDVYTGRPLKDENVDEKNIENGQILKSKQLIKSDIRAQYYIDDLYKLVDNLYERYGNPGLINSNNLLLPQQNENWYKKNFKNGQIIKSKKQIKSDMKAQFYSENVYEDDEDDEYELGAPAFPQFETTSNDIKTQLCVGLNEHRNRVGRKFKSDDILTARNPFHRARAIGKRKKRQIEPSSDLKHESLNVVEPSSDLKHESPGGVEPSSDSKHVFLIDGDHSFDFKRESLSGDSRESYYGERDYESEDDGSDVKIDTSITSGESNSEVYPDEYVAYENALKNVGFVRQYG